MDQTVTTGLKALKTKQVAAKCGAESERWVWLRVKNDPEFPRPFYPSLHQPRFLEHEVDAWLALQVSRRNTPRTVRFGGRKEIEVPQA